MDIVENFNRAADGYEAFSAPQSSLAEALAGWVTPGERHGRALEFGAGTGLFTQHLQPWTGSYLATDAAARMVARGAARCPMAKWEKHDVRDSADFGSADWIFSCSLLQWMEEPEKILRNWRGLLAPRGRLVTAILLRNTLGELQALLPEATPLRWRTAEDWRTMFERAGFAIERDELWEHVSVHPSALALLRAVHAMGLAPRQRVGPGRLRAALRAYDQRFSTPTGVRATWQAWLARGTVA